MSVRPIAVATVAEATPLALDNLRGLSRWCDLILIEGTTTINGEVREPLSRGWRDLLALQPPRLRIITTDLAGKDNWERESIQRDAALPLLVREEERRPVLLVDTDEILDSERVLRRIEKGLDRPMRLGLVPLYGAIDRIAPGGHCCRKPEGPDLRQRSEKSLYLVPASALAMAGMFREATPTQIRFRSPLAERAQAFGVHATLAEPIEQVAWKLRNTRHLWDARVYEPRHLSTMLSAGVHHAGWWIADYREPEPWLIDLAKSAQLRIAGAELPRPHLHALRAWAEARLDPRIPDSLVAACDQYAAKRPADAADFFPELDAYLLSRPMRHSGHLSDDPGFIHP